MRSIRTRLLVLLIPVTVLALAVTAVGIERAVRRDLEKGMDNRLLLIARGIGTAVSIEVDGEVEFDLDEDGISGSGLSDDAVFYAVADEKGSPLFFSSPPPPVLFGKDRESPSFFHASVDGKELRVCFLSFFREPESDEDDRQAWLEEHPGQALPASESRQFQVAAGLSDDGLKETLSLLRRRLATGFSILGLLLVLFPSWAVGGALRPLRRLSRQADSIGPEDPKGRLEETSADREVQSLAKGLNRALDRLVQAVEKQKRFTADAAHELRTPLSAIRAQCEVNLRKPRSSEELVETLKSIHRTSLRFGGLVESLLALSQLENEKIPLSLKPLNLAETVRDAVDILKSAHGGEEVTIIVHLPESIPVQGDEALLMEGISNILDNAVRYTPPGGKVEIEGGADPHPWLAVSDSGPGIPEEHIGRIFERFYQADPSRSGSAGGAGLGLSITREIARSHGAALTVESTVGKGSRFSIEFTSN